MDNLLPMRWHPGETGKATLARLLRFWALCSGLAEVLCFAVYDKDMFAYAALFFFAVYMGATHWAMRLQASEDEPLLW
ncbi:hypothetical protein [Arthrobacter sp. H14]|uniref:hypothetical protein n=1 Tax=Arthrobacter sp. H14 TaxID=1312959 RepID=UPI00047B2413|nr:hypothetical protein [Arthrobacter sp. H14]